jgi:multiple sugar transport system substrate-binding protein
MRRGLALLLAPLLIVGCKKAASDGRTPVRFLVAPDVGGFTKEIISRFETENPAYRVEMVEGPASGDTRENMYSTAFMGKEDTYDLVYMDVVWMPKFAAQGWLRPLDDWFTKEMRKEFLPGEISGSTYKGKLYRIPIQSDGGVLYYRKDLLEAKGIKPPQTWAELVAAAKKLQSPPDLWGFVFQGKQYEGLVCAFLEMVWGNGGDLVNDKGEVVIDQPKAVEALQELVDAIHKDKITPQAVLTYQEEESRHAFQEGKAVFLRNWPYVWNLFQDEKSQVKGKVGQITMVHGPGQKGAATLGGWGYGVSAFSKNPEAAWKFAEFSSRPENQKIAYLKGGILPTRKAVFSDADVLQKSPHLKELGKVLGFARPRPVLPFYARVSDALQLHVSSALSGQEAPQEALSAAAKEIRSVLATAEK